MNLQEIRKKYWEEACPCLLKKFNESEYLNAPGFSTALPWPQLDNEWLPHYIGNMHLIRTAVT
jgi:hypothetical protein